MIQKFVYSKSSKNQVLKCFWQENEQLIIERAFNIHSMYETKIELNDRVHTFEALGPNKKPMGVGVCQVEKDVP